MNKEAVISNDTKIISGEANYDIAPCDRLELQNLKELYKYVADFRNTLEMSWSRNTTLHKTEAANRFNPEGQSTVSSLLLQRHLLDHFRDYDTDLNIGSVYDANSELILDNHSWITIKYQQGHNMVIDVTPDRAVGLSQHCEKRIIVDYESNLINQGIVYHKECVLNLSQEPDSRIIEDKVEILERRFKSSKDNQTVLDNVKSQNIYVVGGVSSGKTELARRLEGIFPDMHVVDTGNLFRIVANYVLNTYNPEEEDSLFDPVLLELVKKNDLQSNYKFQSQLGNKTRDLKQLLEGVKIKKGQNGSYFIVGGYPIGKTLVNADVDSLVPHVAQAQNVRRLIENWLNDYANTNGGLILTGHNLAGIDTTMFNIINLRVSDEVASRRALERDPKSYSDQSTALDAIVKRNYNDAINDTHQVLDYLGVDSINTSDLSLDGVVFASLKRIISKSKYNIVRSERQSKIEVERNKFNWELNDTVALIRSEGVDIFRAIIQEEVDKGIESVPTEFDLSIQTMIEACSYRANEIWIGNDSKIEEIINYIRNNGLTIANNILKTGIKDGTIKLNEDLIRSIAQRQLDKLYHFIGDDSSNLNIPNYATQDSTPFESNETEVTVSGKQIIKNQDGSTEWIIYEKNSNMPIRLALVEPCVSKAYAERFHYLHAGRSDEYRAFGAYIDGEETPFAWVSYSQVDRKYKKELLEYNGLEPHRILEMTRAWNAPWAPKNSMSLLFSFAHSELQRIYKHNTAPSNGKQNKDLEGIITAINPNLGFRANAFNGVDFGVIGLKPADFTYLLDSNGLATYMPRREIAKVLNIETRDLDANPNFMRNKIPLAPTNEMVVLFDGKKRTQPNGPIYQITKEDYKEIQK